MKKINALVVDDSKDFTNDVSEYFRNNNKINILNVISNGEDVIPFIENNIDDIDVILMDLIIPGKDGIAILEEMAKKKIEKHVIVLSSYCKDYTLRMTGKYHVDYFMMKPCNYESLESRIKEVFVVEQPELYMDKELNNTVKIKVSNLLHDLGVPSQLKGYQYLREGILMLYQSTGFIGGITKEVYPEIARRYETTPSRVERAIRHAIEVSWIRGDYDVMNKIFGHSIDFDRSKPTNSEFMVALSDALRLDNHTIRVYA